MAELWGIVIAGWFCSAIVGGIIGSGPNNARGGVVLGVVFALRSLSTVESDVLSAQITSTRTC